GDINGGLKARHLRHARERGKTGAYMFVGDKIKMQPRLRNILKPDRHVPRLRWLNHENSDPRFCQHVGISRTGEWRPNWKMQAARPADARTPASADGAASGHEMRLLCPATGTRAPTPRCRHRDCRVSTARRC